MEHNNVEELKILNSLNNDEVFEKEFESIKMSYPMEDMGSIRSFLKDNPEVIIILNNVKPLLDNHVPYSEFYLRMDFDPLFTPQLQLVVNAHKKDFNNGFKDDIMKINCALRPLISKLDLSCEFFIFDGMIHEDN